MLKLLLIDDHLLVRTGFKSLLLTFENCSVVAEASCGEDALVLYKQHSPDIVILEIDMPGMGGTGSSTSAPGNWLRAVHAGRRAGRGEAPHQSAG